MMERNLFKSAAHSAPLQGHGGERATTQPATNLAEQMRRNAREFDEKAAEMEKRTPGRNPRNFPG
jgi:hypothetical protein